MKKIISLVLMLVLVFSFGVSSFAYPESDTEMEALNEIEYWTYWIHQDFTGYFNDTNEWLTSIWQILTNSIALNVNNMAEDLSSALTGLGTLVSRSESSLSNLIDINEFVRSVNDELTSLNDNLFGNFAFLQPFAHIIQDSLIDIYDQASDISTNTYNALDTLYNIDIDTSNISNFLNILNGTTLGSWELYNKSWFSYMYNDLHQLKEVLADDEDLAFKESQKDNQQYVQDTFFSPNSDLSLNLDKLGDFTGYVESFKTSFDFSSVDNKSPFDMVGEGSDFSKWFSEETALSIDPTYGGGSGGGGGEIPDPDEPDPDEPDPDEPDPPTPTIKNWLPLATTEPGGTEIYNGTGYLSGHRWSNSSSSVVSASGWSVSGFIPCKPGDVLYFENYNYPSAGDFSYSFFFYDSSLDSHRVTLPIDKGSTDSFSIIVPKNSYNFTYFRFNFGSSSIPSVYVNQIPNQTASTFSLRAQSVPYQPEIVTSAYADRMNEFYKLLGGDN